MSPAPWSPARLVLLLIGAGLAVRVALAASTGLGIDESYMVAAGRTLRLSYFDHPPMSWWLSRGAALLAGSEAPVVVRAPFIALFAASTWLMFAWTRRLFDARAGVWAAVALNLSPVFGITSATWVLPDGSLICALLAAAFCLTRALESSLPTSVMPGLDPGTHAAPQHRPSVLGKSAHSHGRKSRNRVDARDKPGQDDINGLAWPWWLAAGLCAGLTLLSKYSAALVLAGAAIYVLTQPSHRSWLRWPHPYAAAAVALACCVPILVWNARNGWASFAFQGGRAGAASFHPFGPLATLGGEALFLLPWIWLPLMIAWIGALRAGPSRWRSWLPACLGVVPVVLFVVVSFWARHVLFHWAAPGYLMLFPLLGAWLANASPRLTRIGSRATVALVAAGVAVLMIEARVNMLAPFGTDPGFQATDWTPLAAELESRSLLHRPDTVIAATNWQDAGKLDYGLGGVVPVIVLNPDARQYLFSPGWDAFPGRDVLIIGPRLDPERLRRTYGGVFRDLEALPPFVLRGVPIGVFLAR